ncbi:MAG: hypothetical protein KatS3mg101_0472 [Patescibacteria group bacterium]|nr:MAG: hypothetical protein KatS3mg101_0472 [Patescibacteria group bacterium]
MVKISKFWVDPIPIFSIMASGVKVASPTKKEERVMIVAE